MPYVIRASVAGILCRVETKESANDIFDIFADWQDRPKESVNAWITHCGARIELVDLETLEPIRYVIIEEPANDND